MHISLFCCTFAADFNPKTVVIATQFVIQTHYGYTKKRVCRAAFRQQSQYEIDFIVNTGSEQLYIQSALNVDTKEKMEQETFSLRNIRDSFRKIVILDGNTHPWMNDEGVTFMGVIPFLLGIDKALI